MISLRNRALAGAVFWASTIIGAGSYLLGGYLDQQTRSRFDDQLFVRHAEAVVAVANSSGDTALIEAQLARVDYQQPYSGFYWQIEGPDRLATSRSMVTSVLSDAAPVTADLAIAQIAGPSNQMLRATRQEVTLDSGEAWIVRVAASTAPLVRDREELSNRLNLAFIIVGLIGVLGSMLLVIATLRPLAQLREEVSSRWDTQNRLDTARYPLEVRPLVDDINGLMVRNRDIVERSNRQAADLAHALKTPAAIVRNELEKLQLEGVKTDRSLDALNRLDAQLQRSLARMRAAKSGAVDNVPADVSVPMKRMARAFESLARNRQNAFAHQIDDGLRARIDIHDLDEICGNILDNALKWSRQQVLFWAKQSKNGFKISVADDGPGIPEDQRQAVLSGGTRLDEATPGTGLGLSIASDLVAAYNGDIEIGRCDALGGARIVITLPA